MVMEKQIYPVSTASFETIRTRGFVYIDKTEYVYRLAGEGSSIFSDVRVVSAKVCCSPQ